jgi:acyl dehydratase
MPRAVDLAALAPGALVAQFSPEPSTHESLAAYAEASGDSNPLHLDLDFARQAGFDNLVVHGMVGMAQLGRLLTDHFAAERLRSFEVRFEGMILAGQRVTYRARLQEASPQGARLALEAVLESGTRVISGTALISS